jgi:hypothetical protein
MDDPDQIREYFARFGRSMYFAQVLEHGLVNTIVIARLASLRPPVAGSLPGSEHLVDGRFDTHLQRTTGQLVAILRSMTTVPTDLEDRFTGRWSLAIS